MMFSVVCCAFCHVSVYVILLELEYPFLERRHKAKAKKLVKKKLHLVHYSSSVRPNIAKVFGSNQKCKAPIYFDKFYYLLNVISNIKLLQFTQLLRKEHFFSSLDSLS